MEMNVLSKKCSNCEVSKESSQFCKKPTSKNGLASICRECDNIRGKKYRILNKDKESIRSSKYYKNNRETILARRNNRSQDQKDLINQQERTRVATDIQFKLTKILRSRIRTAIKKNTKTGSAIRDLGCSATQLKEHLESKFQPGMNWDNHSFEGWHIDHIIPLSSFDLTDREEFLRACHYTNLQPLWAKDNMKKSNKIEEQLNVQA